MTGGKNLKFLKSSLFSILLVGHVPLITSNFIVWLRFWILSIFIIISEKSFLAVCSAPTIYFPISKKGNTCFYFFSSFVAVSYNFVPFIWILASQIFEVAESISKKGGGLQIFY